MAEHGNFFFKFLKFFFLFVFNLKNLPKWISCQTVVSSHENTHPSKGVAVEMAHLRTAHESLDPAGRRLGAPTNVLFCLVLFTFLFAIGFFERRQRQSDAKVKENDVDKEYRPRENDASQCNHCQSDSKLIFALSFPFKEVQE